MAIKKIIQFLGEYGKMTIKIRDRRKIAVVSILVLLFVILPSSIGAQAPANFSTCTWTQISCIVPLILSTVLAGVIGAMGGLITLLVGILVWVSKYNGFITSTAVVQGWGVIRDIANMFFVLVLLIISFGTILHVQQYQMKTLLPKVLLMAVLVNFSKAIAGLFIDFAQVVMLTFVAAYSAAGPGNILDALGMQSITSINTKIASQSGIPGISNETPLGINNFQIVVAYLLGALFAAVALVVVIAVTLILFIRIVMLWLLIVFSPLAYVLSVVPMGQKYAQQWWEMFSKYVIIGPVLAFFLWLSLASFPSFKSPTSDLNPISQQIQGDTAKQQLPDASITGIGAPEQVVGFIVSISMLVMSLIFAQQVGGAAGKIAGNAYGKLASGGKLLATKAPFALGRYINERQASGMKVGKWRIPGTGVSLNYKDYAEKWRETRKKTSEERMAKPRAGIRDVMEYGVARSVYAKARRLNVSEEVIKERDRKKKEMEDEKKKVTGQTAVEEQRRWAGVAEQNERAAAQHEEESEGAISDITKSFFSIRKNKAVENAIGAETKLNKLEEEKGSLEKERSVQTVIVFSPNSNDKQRNDAQKRQADINKRLVEIEKEKQSLGEVSTRVPVAQILQADQARIDAGSAATNLNNAKLALSEHEKNKPDEKASKADRNLYIDKRKDLLGEVWQAEDESSAANERLVNAQAEVVQKANIPDLPEINKSSVSTSLAAFKESQGKARKQRDEARYAEAFAIQTPEEITRQSEESAAREAASAVVQIKALDDNMLGSTEVVALLQRIDQDIQRGKEQIDSEKASDEEKKDHGEREMIREQLRRYQEALQTGGDISGFKDFANRDDGEAVKAAKLTEEERKSKLPVDKKVLKEKRDELVAQQEDAQIRARHFEGPYTVEGLRELDQGIATLANEIKGLREAAAATRLPDYYRQQADRSLVSEELKKIQTSNSEELIRHFRDAQRSGDKYKMMAVLQKLAHDANDNEVLNDYGYSSDFDGYKKFFMEQVAGNAGITEQEALRIANDVSFVNEERNHWETARTVTTDATTGGFKWKTEREHVGEALAEIRKMDPPQIVRRLNRLAYGGEVPQADGSLRFRMSALGAGILETLQEQGALSNFIKRRDLQANIAINLNQALRDNPIPEFARSARELNEYIGTLPGKISESVETAMRRTGRV